jgi:small subunit ribosomal protein S9
MIKYRNKLKYRKADFEKELQSPDTELGAFIPNLLHDPEFRQKALQELPHESAKLVLGNAPEAYNPEIKVRDAVSAEKFAEFEAYAINYLKAKMAMQEDDFLAELRAMSERMTDDQVEHALQHDREIDEKFDFMYNVLDYDSDRTKVRDQFLKDVTKRSSLADIGETLDKLTVASKAANYQYYKASEHHDAYPQRASRDFVSTEWSAKLCRSTDPYSPSWLENPESNYAKPETTANKMEEIVDKVQYADVERDHSYQALSQDEKTEISLYHSLRQDAFFKHYLRHHMREVAEHEAEGAVDMLKVDEPIHDNLFADHMRFDRLNLYDFRRNLPMQSRESKIDSKSRAYGYSRRKKARALVRVEPGKGRIMVNGKPMLQALLHPMQRQRILLPLVLTNYTCLLDVHIRVWGGGFNGQTEAIIPALAKAVAGFDINTRKPLRHYNMMHKNHRNKERKKIGKIKARKGLVYRRR